MKIISLLAFCVGMLFGAILQPSKSIEAKGIVQNMALVDGNIIVGTSAGTLEVYVLKEAHKVMEYTFEPIKDFTGDTVAPKVFSVDKYGTSYLAVVQASSGARELKLLKDSKLTTLIPASANQFIAKARFVDETHILIALLSNEVILWDVTNNKALYQRQINPSHFSDFSLNESKNRVAFSCESGEVTLCDVATGKTIKVLKSGNVDNVYKVDFRQNKVACAGQDRRGIVYSIDTGSFERYDAPFLIYATALSPSERYSAFAFNEQNDIVLFDGQTKNTVHTLKGQKSTLNTIIFASEKELVSSSDDTTIMIWRLP